MGVVSGILEATMFLRPRACVLLVLSVFFVGCGNTQRETATSSVVVSPAIIEASTYSNTRFGYQLTIPDGVLVYALNLEDKTARLAGSDDEIVFVAGEGTNVLTIRGIESEGSAHEWLTNHVSFFYPKGEAAQQIEKLDGRQMLSLYGNGTSNSPARLLVVQNQNDLIAITFEEEFEAFDNILSSFTFLP